MTTAAKTFRNVARLKMFERPTESPPAKEDIFELLANRRRRFAVHLLKREQRPLQIGEMAERIAAWENEVDVEAVTCEQRKRVYTGLQQLHLPKLDESGIAVYNDRAGCIEPTDALYEFDIYVEALDDTNMLWSQYYLSLSAFGLIMLAVVSLNVWPTTVLPEIAWAVFIVVTLGVSALLHHRLMKRQRLGFSDMPPELVGAEE